MRPGWARDRGTAHAAFSGRGDALGRAPRAAPLHRSARRDDVVFAFRREPGHAEAAVLAHRDRGLDLEAVPGVHREGVSRRLSGRIEQPSPDAARAHPARPPTPRRRRRAAPSVAIVTVSRNPSSPDTANSAATARPSRANRLPAMPSAAVGVGTRPDREGGAVRAVPLRTTAPCAPRGRSFDEDLSVLLEVGLEPARDHGGKGAVLGQRFPRRPHAACAVGRDGGRTACSASRRSRRSRRRSARPTERTAAGGRRTRRPPAGGCPKRRRRRPPRRASRPRAPARST